MKKLLLFLMISSTAFAVNVVQQKIVVNGDMSSAEVDSVGIDMRQLINASVQAVYTGAPVGVLKLQFSDEIQVQGCEISNTCCPSSTTYNDYTGSEQNISSAGKFAWNLLDSGYTCLRLVYVKTSGTGSLNATFSGKGPK